MAEGTPDFAATQVLAEGLPSFLPDGIERGARFPVAVWTDGASGIVAYIARGRSDDTYDLETESLTKDSHQSWVRRGTGSSSWVNVFRPPVELLEQAVALVPTIMWELGAAGERWTVAGMCNRAVATIQTDDASGITKYTQRRDWPFFVIVTRGPTAVVRFLAGSGGDVVGSDGITHELYLDWSATAEVSGGGIGDEADE